MFLDTADFTYAGFGVSRYNLRDYLDNIKGRQALFQRYNCYAFGIVDSIIYSISTNNVQFNVKDQEICRLLEELVRAGGYDEHGVYSESAHQAMRNLCIMQGKNPEHHVLYNKNIPGRVDKIKNKIQNLFGFGNKKQQEQRPVPASSRKNKILYRVTATLTGLMAVGTAVFMTSDLTKSNTESDVDAARVSAFKTISVGDTTHHAAQILYKLDKWRLSRNAQSPFFVAKPALKPMHGASARVAPVATDSASVRLTRASQSALNVLLGQKKADKLCRQVQAQIDAGIFAAPRGMSVQRIAHAMTMSRIYEGKSVILDALKSTKRLTPAQQAAFAQHIDEIGDLGVKLQQRMASGHRLSTHSRYAQAPRALQQAHVKNLKQLKQLRKMARTR